MRTAIYQMEVIPGKPEENIKKIDAWIKSLNDDIELAVLPEMWNTSYVLEDLKELASEEGTVEIEAVKQMAKEKGIHIVAGSIAVKSNDNIYNRAFVVDKTGTLVHAYDKMHLVPMLDEPDYLTAGDCISTFTLEGIPMGMIICYDLRFPELSRKLALEEIEVLFVVAEWPESRIDHFEKLLYARAIENQVVVVAANSTGSCEGTEFGGTSMVISPLGERLTVIEENEATVVCEIDIHSSKQVREDIPVFTSRRPELY